MPKLEKVFKSTTRLQQRGLGVDEPMFGGKTLIRTSYYEIINGYKEFFIVSSYVREREIADRFIQLLTSEILDYVISFSRHDVMLLTQMNILTALCQDWSYHSQ